MFFRNRTVVRSLGIAVGLVTAMCLSTAAAGDSVKGTFTANDQAVELTHGYVHAEDHPFDEGKKAYVFLFTDRALEADQVEDAWMIDGLTSVEVTIGEDQQSLGHNLHHPALTMSNISGGGNNKVEFESFGPEVFKGRTYMPEKDDFFDNIYIYDVAFTVAMRPPEEPKGKPLPAGGGEPGKSYLKFLKVVAAGDIEQLKTFMPPEAHGELEGPDGKDMLEMLQIMTPTEAKVLGGRIDGETAVIEVEAKMDEQTAKGEITMVKVGKVWSPKKSAWH